MSQLFNKILLVQTGFLGDLILSTPVVSAIKKLYPDAKIDILCTKEGAPLVRTHPFVSNVLVFDKRVKDAGLRGLIARAREIRLNSYECVFSLHKSYRTALLLYLSRIPLRYGFKEAALSWLYTSTAPRKDLSHEVLRNLAILRNLNLNPSEYEVPMSIGIPEEVNAKTKETVVELSKPYISIAPGSVWKTKRWTKEGFARLSAELIDRGFGIVLIGGPGDSDTGDFIDAELKKSYQSGKDYINTIGSIDLISSASLISSSELVITNDSAPLHLGSAVGTPVLALFCATVPEQGFGPWMVSHRIVERKELSCRPCGRHGSQSCPLGTDECQKSITVPEVLLAVDLLLEERKAKFS